MTPRDRLEDWTRYICHRFALDHHNLDSRMREILRIARGVLDEYAPR
jgi:hypothetical protein